MPLGNTIPKQTCENSRLEVQKWWCRSTDAETLNRNGVAEALMQKPPCRSVQSWCAKVPVQKNKCRVVVQTWTCGLDSTQSMCITDAGLVVHRTSAGAEMIVQN